MEGEIPSPVNIGPGCRFAGRCPKVFDICSKVTPELLPVPGEGQEWRVACHLYNEEIGDREKTP